MNETRFYLFIYYYFRGKFITISGEKTRVLHFFYTRLSFEMVTKIRTVTTLSLFFELGHKELNKVGSKEALQKGEAPASDTPT